jgi:hypothetical protein
MKRWMKWTLLVAALVTGIFLFAPRADAAVRVWVGGYPGVGVYVGRPAYGAYYRPYYAPNYAPYYYAPRVRYYSAPFAPLVYPAPVYPYATPAYPVPGAETYEY